MARFHTLRVAAVDRLTDDSVALTLTVPPELRQEYRHAPGQHLALRRTVDGTEIRRTYSICSPAPEADGPHTLRVGVRLVEGGAFSMYALKEIDVGDALEVMTPAGRFTLAPAPGLYAAVVGGSGITPVLSIVSTLLAREPQAPVPREQAPRVLHRPSCPRELRFAAGRRSFSRTSAATGATRATSPRAPATCRRV